MEFKITILYARELEFETFFEKHLNGLENWISYTYSINQTKQNRRRIMPNITELDC